MVEDAPYRAYRGHSSHVMCVRFNARDTLVNSAGGKDRAVFQFKFVKIEAKPTPVPEAPLEWGPIDSTGELVEYTAFSKRLTVPFYQLGKFEPSTMEPNCSSQGNLRRTIEHFDVRSSLFTA